LNQAIRTTRYNKYIPYYSSYTRPVERAKENNWQSVLSRRIIIQSLVCILIIFLVSWLQNQGGESATDIVSQIRIQVVEKNIEPGEIYDAIIDTYEECYQYLQGSN